MGHCGLKPPSSFTPRTRYELSAKPVKFTVFAWSWKTPYALSACEGRKFHEALASMSRSFATLPEVSRIVRPGGLVIATMLNPASPYRLFEWCIYWPARRLAGRIEGLLGIQPSRPHGARRSGIRAVRRGRLARLMRGAGLTPYDVVAFDITSTVPPFDKLVRRHRQRWRDHPERTVSRGLRGRMGTGYLIAARKAPV